MAPFWSRRPIEDLLDWKKADDQILSMHAFCKSLLISYRYDGDVSHKQEEASE